MVIGSSGCVSLNLSDGDVVCDAKTGNLPRELALEIPLKFIIASSRKFLQQLSATEG